MQFEAMRSGETIRNHATGETLTMLAGGAAKDGLPRNPIVRLVFIRTSQGFLPEVPLFLQRGLFAVAGWVAPSLA